MNQSYFVALSFLWVISLTGSELLHLSHQLELLASGSHKNQSVYSIAHSSFWASLGEVWAIIKPQGPFDQYKLQYKEVLEKIGESSKALKQNYLEFMITSNAEEREKFYQNMKQLIDSLPVDTARGAVLNFAKEVYSPRVYAKGLYAPLNELEETLLTKDAYKELKRFGGPSHKIPSELLNMIVDNGASYQFSQQTQAIIDEIKSLYRMLDTKGAEYIRICEEFSKESPLK